MRTIHSSVQLLVRMRKVLSNSITISGSPHLCGIYFREKEMRSQSEMRRMIDSVSDIEETKRDRSFTPPDLLLKASYIPFLFVSGYSRQAFSSYALESLLNTENINKVRESEDGIPKKTWHDIHRELLESKSSRIIGLNEVVPFSIDDFIKKVRSRTLLAPD